MRDVVEIQVRRTKAHLVLEPEPSLIDCGLAGPGDRIARAILTHGRDPADLRRVVITIPTTPAPPGRLADAGPPS